ncbi:MAG: 5'/3'-nucleotidase SurE [Bacteroidales bacterium]|nr:5'/3'-nucleotidase SurE [Bacteroidales bacterium]
MMMKDRLKILVTNDDGYQARGIRTLVRLLRPYGDLTVISPKNPQSGKSVAVSMGFVPIAVKKYKETEGERWWYLDGTPSSCVKFGIDNIFWPYKPDIVVSGINHGSNAATAALYSGTIGAAMEGAINGVKAIGISLDDFSPNADFSIVERHFPAIFETLVTHYSKRAGTLYNINFPSINPEKVRGVRVGSMGMAHWEHEYERYTPEVLAKLGHTPQPQDIWYVEHAEEGEEMYVMAGDFTDNVGNSPTADHLLLSEGYITITPHNINNTDYDEMRRLCDII